MDNLSSIFATRLKELRESKNLSLAALSDTLTERYGIKISKESLTNYEVSDIHHTKARKNEGMNVKYLRCLADFYGVTTDFLLGLSDIPTNRPDFQAACLTTGLSREAVSTLNLFSHRESIFVRVKNCTRPSIDTVDKLISSKSFLRLINQLTFYLIYSCYLSEDVSSQAEKPLTHEEFEEHQRFYKWANSQGLEVMLRDDVAEMHLQTACDELKSIFREILEHEKSTRGTINAINP